MLKNKLLGIELSNKKLRYVYVEKKGLGFSISKKGTVSLKESVPLANALFLSIQEIISKERLSPAKLFAAISREDLNTQQIIIPKMPPAEIEEVVVGEIERNPVFYARDFEYVYSYSELDKNRLKVIFCAVFKEVIDAVVDSAKSLKLRLESVELAPLNLLSIAYKLNREKEEAFIVLDEKLCYVIIFHKKECKLLYTCSTGRLDLYNLGDEKFNNGAFLNFAAEIKRIFKSYVLEYKGSEPQRVWFVWDNEFARDLDTLLSKELQKEVSKVDWTLASGFSADINEKLNPIYTVTCAPLISYVKNLKGEFSFDKLIKQEKLKRALAKLTRNLFLYLIILVVVLGLTARFFAAKKAEIAGKLSEVNSQVKILEKETETLKEARQKAQYFKERLLNQATFVSQLNRVSWSKVFGEMVADLPEGISFTSFKVTNIEKAELKGDAFNIENIAELMRRIDRSEVLTEAKFDFLRENKIKDKKIYNYGILSALERDTGEEK